LLEMKIKDFPEEERPRERLRRLGPGSLSDAELLAIILGHGLPGESAVDLGRRLLALGALHRLSLEELESVPGVGPAKAVRIKAALELGRRVQMFRERLFCISSPAEAYSFFSHLGFEEEEQLWALLLNRKNGIIGRELVALGGISRVPVDPRDLFRAAVRRNAAALILAHNHPSGDPSPSPEDISLTRRLVEAGKLLGVEVLDHLVVVAGGYVSMRAKGVAFA